MLNRILLVLAFVCAQLCTYAQEKHETTLYTGTINGNLAITLFLDASPHHCEDATVYSAIYNYDKNANNDNWLWLNIDHNEKGRFVMVEEDFTGVMILEKKGDTFTGIWINPDGKTQLKVEMKKKNMSKEEKEKFLERLENTNHRYHDC